MDSDSYSPPKLVLQRQLFTQQFFICLSLAIFLTIIFLFIYVSLKFDSFSIRNHENIVFRLALIFIYLFLMLVAVLVGFAPVMKKITIEGQKINFYYKEYPGGQWKIKREMSLEGLQKIHGSEEYIKQITETLRGAQWWYVKIWWCDFVYSDKKIRLNAAFYDPILMERLLRVLQRDYQIQITNE